MRKFMNLAMVFLCAVLMPSYLIAGGSHSSGLKGDELSLVWIIPFCGVLLSLAIMPLLAPKFWHAHFGKISLAWALISIWMIMDSFGFFVALSEILDVYVHHFIPFIIFILSLYVIAGGIKIDILTKPNPYFNTIFLGVTSFIASWIGTTGAAMLFIRPFLHVNQARDSKRHLVIFFIFLVCNIGGSLTAVGDPPLFLGFLNGVDFFWPTTHMFGPFLTVTIPLLCIFFFMDNRAFKKEGISTASVDGGDRFILKFSGRRNFLYLMLAVSAIILSGLWKTESGITIYHTKILFSDVFRDLALLGLTILSLTRGNQNVRKENKFSWAPFMEVLKVFAAIFVTAAPVIAILKAGSNGSLSSLVAMVNTPEGPNNFLYFWITGGLSSVLDNAPTYLVFFNLAGGDAEVLMTTLSKTLLAISAGSVFLGAMTYIGNAPNFMIKSIAESDGISMPSFFGYVAWSCAILLPVFLLVSFIWL